MIAETAIVGVLLYGHYLYTVIAFLLDTRQDVETKFLIGAYSLGILSHADMAFVDKQRAGLTLEMAMTEFIRLLRSPNLGAEYLCLVILHYSLGPCRYALSLTALPLHQHLVELAMVHSVTGQGNLPNAVGAYGLQLIVVGLLPVVKIANEIDGGGVGCPLAENPFAVGRLVKAEVLVSGSKIL
jgi:hypothetical protein